MSIRTLKRPEGRAPAAKLAVGYVLDKLKNDITRETPAYPKRSLPLYLGKLDDAKHKQIAEQRVKTEMEEIQAT